MLAVANPVELGFVASLSHPGGNITGVASAVGDLTSTLLEIAKELLPSASRIGLLFNEGNPLNYAKARRSETEDASHILGVELVWLGVRQVDDFDSAFIRVNAEKSDAVIGIGDPLLFSHRARINELAEQHRIPMIWGPREYLNGRGLLSYGPSLAAGLRQVARFVDRVLRGASPASLPVELPTAYDLVINLKAARALGLNIPSALLARADEVIE
jgi:putative ABC transport system substrate-binding protein